MMTVNATKLVKGGQIQKHAGAGLFRAFLAGRKPSLILAFYWLACDVGALIALQASLRQPKQPTRKPAVMVDYFDFDLQDGRKAA